MHGAAAELELDEERAQNSPLTFLIRVSLAQSLLFSVTEVLIR